MRERYHTPTQTAFTSPSELEWLHLVHIWEGYAALPQCCAGNRMVMPSPCSPPAADALDLTAPKHGLGFC